MPLKTSAFLPEDSKILAELMACEPIGFGDKPAILVVDVSYGFVASCGGRGQACVERISALLMAARLAGAPVFFSRVRASEDPMVTGRWKQPARGHAISRSHELHEIVETLDVRPNETVIHKSKPSAFWGTDLNSYLIAHGVDTLIVAGLVTSGCVRATVVDAFSLNYRVSVPMECVADACQTSHEVSLVDIHIKYADVMELDEVLHYLQISRKPG